MSTSTDSPPPVKAEKENVAHIEKGEERFDPIADNNLHLMKNLKVIFFCFFVAFGGFLFGYDIGVISGCLIMPDFQSRFGTPLADGTPNLTATQQSEITSLLSAGTFFGSLAQAFTSDRFGRKWSIFVWSFTFTVGIIIQTASETSIGQLMAGRFIAGLGVGAMSAIVPLYNGEAAPKALRGFLVVLYQVQIITGIFFSYILDIACHSIKSSASWRVPVGLQLLWGLILCIGVLFLPESPRYLLGSGRDDEARQAIATMNNTPLDHPLIDEEIAELADLIAEENEGGKSTWIECFSTRNQLWKRTLNGMMLQFVQQLNGQNFYYYYGATFFAQSGTSLGPLEIQLLLGGVSLAATLPALYAIDSIGRRKLLLWGALGEAACAIIAGSVGHSLLADRITPKADLTSKNRTGGNVMVAFAVLQIMCFSFFWGPTPWVYLSESFPLRVRSKAISLGSATNWFWNFMLSYFAPKIAADIGPLILLIFAGMLIYGFFYVYFMIPETKGLALEEVDEMYSSGVKPWKSAGWKPAEKHHTTWTDENGVVHTVEHKKIRVFAGH